MLKAKETSSRGLKLKGTRPYPKPVSGLWHETWDEKWWELKCKKVEKVI